MKRFWKIRVIIDTTYPVSVTNISGDIQYKFGQDFTLDSEQGLFTLKIPI